jgi:hypothetical protein
MEKWGGLLLICTGVWCAVIPAAAQAVAAKNLGLVGTAEVLPDAVDKNGETMGGFFSGMCWDPTSQTLYGLADRGPSNGEVDYRPRVQLFRFTIDLSQTNLHNIALTNKATVLLRDDAGKLFSGADADDATWTNFPRVVSGARALDAEGIVRASDGTFYISEEYGPFVYQFDSGFRMLRAIVPPAHILPKSSAAGGRKINYTATREPDSGREKNHGFEGVGLSPDGTTLFALLQSPCVQDSLRDGKLDKASRNTRLLTWDVRSPDKPKLTGEYIYQLDLLKNGKHAASQSEILVINSDSFLVLERDDHGLGTGKEKQICRIYCASLKRATNLQSIPGRPYSREAGDSKGVALTETRLPAEITPISKTLFVDMLDRTELARAGYPDLQLLPEKWEGLALVELPALPAHQYILLVGVDNDFKTRRGFFKTGAHEDGAPIQVVTSAEEEVPTLLFAYRVELPEYEAPHRPNSTSSR